MTTAVNNQGSQDVYAALGLSAPNSNAAKRKSTLDQADFLRLMTEQLQHQDPLKPMDNTQMVAQMAQMSTVQGITDLNNTVKGFQASMASDQVLRGAALVGHQVLVPSTKMVLGEDGGASGVVAAPGAGIVNVTVTDANGNTVTQLSVEARAAGETTFEWDGKDAGGNRVAAGDYTITATHVDGSGTETKLSTYVQAPVESVTVGSDGLYLNLKGLGHKIEDVSIMLYADHGLDFYGNSVVVSRKFLKDNPKVAQAIEKKVRENAGVVANAMLSGSEEANNDDDGDVPAAPSPKGKKEKVAD